MSVLGKAIVVCLLSLMTFLASAGDAERGKSLSSACAACHGVNGVSSIPMYPNLAGQKELYLISALTAYRDGMRKHMQMSPMAAGLSDKDIEDLSAYYAQLTAGQ
ncbi:c-type cytochrome [Aestuariibacter salexigens]|uniref:c-type cytochrome n=1 Tax=Aestuariibacter salexigens TaxID=226010 RepID=UPI0003FD2159|nr:cytochrome c [Aestuariibacter salexigens]